MRVPSRSLLRTLASATLGLFVSTVGARSAWASTPVIRGDIDTGTVGASVGLDPTWVADLHYTRGLSLQRAPDRSRLVARLGVPVTIMGYAPGFRLDGGWAERIQAKGKNVGIVLSPRTGVTMASTPAGRTTAWTLELSAAPGLYRHGFTFAAQLTWRTALATRVTYSDAALDLFEDRYPPGTDAAEIRDAPSSGRVGFTAQHLRGGVIMGWAVQNTVQLWLAAGVDYQPGDPYVAFDLATGRVPFYGTFGVGYRW